jgi:serine/threonine-protein kinase
MPPEQVRGRHVDYRTDLWALGAVFFRCLTGRLPFEGEDVVELAAKAMYAPPPRATELVPEVPIAVSELLVSCLAADPDGRPDSARMMAHALAAAIPGGRDVAEEVAPTLFQRSGPSDTTIRPPRAHARPTVPGRRRRTATVPPHEAAAIAARAGTGPRGAAALPTVKTMAAEAGPESTLRVRRSRPWTWPRPAGWMVLAGLAVAAATAAIAMRAAARDDRAASTPSALRDSRGPAAATDASPESPQRAAPPPAAAPPAAPARSTPSASRSLESRESDPSMAPSAALAGPTAPDGEPRAQERSPSRARAESGTLVITVYPAADVWVDDKPAGSAPLTRALPAGRHRVKLLGPHEKSETLRVVIHAGQTTRIDRKWSQE